MFKKNPLKKVVPANTPRNKAQSNTIANKPAASQKRTTAGTKKPSLPPNYLDPKMF